VIIAHVFLFACVTFVSELALKLEFQKKPEAQPKQIEIKVAA
jgi:hypothetical protein